MLTAPLKDGDEKGASFTPSLDLNASNPILDVEVASRCPTQGPYSLAALTRPIRTLFYPDFPDACHLTPGSPEYLNLYTMESAFYNDLVLFFLPPSIRASIPHFLQSWLRNYIGGCILYIAGSGLWSLAIYTVAGKYFFDSEETRPSGSAMWKQAAVSMAAIPLYSLLPTVSEWLIEKGWTLCYAQIQEVSTAYYLLQLVAYLSIVEFGIYWAHRGLHDVKFLYKWLHATHHIYNKQNTLSPFAGLAFHPLDGITQAFPHVIALFLTRMHFLSHLLLLFLEGIWTTNIHDNIHANVFPIMGAGYHTIHHTTYKHNYGHYTIVMDWLFGTLVTPEEYKQKRA